MPTSCTSFWTLEHFCLAMYSSPWRVSNLTTCPGTSVLYRTLWFVITLVVSNILQLTQQKSESKSKSKITDAFVFCTLPFALLDYSTISTTQQNRHCPAIALHRWYLPSSLLPSSNKPCSLFLLRVDSSNVIHCLSVCCQIKLSCLCALCPISR